jgi:thioredoxin 2
MTDSLHLACPNCFAVNRVPGARLNQQPQCGQCHKPLLGGRPTTLSTAAFDRFVGRSDLPVVVDFWAPWCGPCRMMAPAFEQAAVDLATEARLVKVDTEAEPGLGQRFAVRSIPTLVVFLQGTEVARQSGALGAADIVRWVRAQSR